MTGAGAILGEDGRIRFFAGAGGGHAGDRRPRHGTPYGRDPKYDLELTGTRVYYGTAGGSVRHRRRRRSGSTLDRLPRIPTTRPSSFVHHLDNVHFFQRAMVCRDVADNFLDGYQHALRLAARVPPSMSARAFRIFVACRRHAST